MKTSIILVVLASFITMTATWAEEVRLSGFVVSLEEKCLLSISKGDENAQVKLPKKGKCIFAKDRKNNVAVYKPSKDEMLLLIVSSEVEGKDCISKEAGLLFRKGQILLQDKELNKFASCPSPSYSPDQKNFAGALHAITNKSNYRKIKLKK